MKKFNLMSSLALIATLALQLMPMQSAQADDDDHFKFRRHGGWYGRPFGYRNYGRHMGYRSYPYGRYWGFRRDHGRHLGYRNYYRRWY